MAAVTVEAPGQRMMDLEGLDKESRAAIDAQEYVKERRREWAHRQ